MAGDSGNQAQSLSRETCASLQGLAIPASAIGLPTTGALVETAAFVTASEAGNINGDFCKVTGIVKPHHAGSPNLEFEVNLPAAWNRRALQMGGGGYDGSLVTGLTVYSNRDTHQRHAPQARLRHARQRRRPQGQGRVRRQLRAWTMKRC